MPTGSILAYSIPDGANVLVDGVSYPTTFGFPRTPAIIPGVPAGSHNVTFTLPGYESVTIPTSVPQAGYSTVTAIMRPAR